jgi:hypothetical protein
MCFNAPVSFMTFLFGLLGSLLLIYYGNPVYKKENIIFGISFIIISLVQFHEFLLWIDINNKWNINKIITLLSPFLILGQPTMIYLIKLYYLKPNNLLSFENYNVIVLLLNILYAILFIVNYVIYFVNGEHITRLDKGGHLKWPWINYSIKYMFSLFYLIILPINILYLTNFNYSFLVLLITYIFLLLSCYYFSYNVGELWCFFGVFIPFIIFIISKYLM